MAKNYKQPGTVIPVLLAAVAIAGRPVVSGRYCGIAQEAGEIGDTINVLLAGVFTVDNKLTGTAWVQGDALFYDTAADKVTKVATGNTFIGFAFADAASGASSGDVDLKDPGIDAAALANAEVTTNKVTSLSGASTDVQYPSAKLVYDQLALKAPLSSPAFTDAPTAPTAAGGTNTTQLATTQFVQQQATNFGTATGTDTYAVTTNISVPIIAGLRITVRFTNASTGASTLAVNGGTAAPIVKKDGSTAIGAADIAANTYYDLMFISPVVGFVALGI
jgi:predicted RecA/RadA family phage recombinase